MKRKEERQDMQPYYYFLNRNKNGDGFQELRNGEIFIDKTGLIEEINSRIATKEKWICVSKPRRFGKTMALEMLAAYYTKGIHTWYETFSTGSWMASAPWT